MVEAVMLWNEPNNLSHWDFKIDPEWKLFAEMAIAGAQAMRRVNPEMTIALGGISPIDPNFVRLMGSYGVLDAVDVVAVHGFPLDWNHWQIHEWPEKIDEIRAVTKQAGMGVGGGSVLVRRGRGTGFGLQRTAELLLPLVERVHWYSLFDLPATWTATTRHKEAEGSAYYRHYYMGLMREDGTPKLAASYFPEGLGICQWFHFEDHRLEAGVAWLRKLGVKYLRTGVSWADWFRPERRGMVRPADAGRGGLRDHADAVLYARAPGRGAALYEPSEECGGLCRVYRDRGRWAARAMRRPEPIAAS